MNKERTGNTGDYDAGRGIIAKRTNEKGMEYRKGNVVGWDTARGIVVAELVDNHYVNHRYHNTEAEALNDIAERRDK